MRGYPNELLRILKDNVSYQLSYGNEITVKGIPDSDINGQLDTREFALALEAAQKYRPARNIQDIRDDCGFPGRYLNTGMMLTDCITLENDGHPFRIWIYWPRKPLRVANRKALIYIHGGSLFSGSALFLENVCRYISEAADCVVFNIDYSLAPENPFPMGYNDCKIALDYIYENAERYGASRDKLCISGDSAGGGLAAAVALSDTRRRIKLMALLYPCVLFDILDLPFDWNENDYEINDAQRFLIIPRLRLGRSDGKGDNEFMKKICTMYLQNGEDRRDPRISPFFADLTDAPRSLIITAEYDGLRPQGEYFASMLEKAGGDVTTIRYRGVFHAFVEKIGFVPQAEDALIEVAEAIRRL